MDESTADKKYKLLYIKKNTILRSKYLVGFRGGFAGFPHPSL
jgi:hypothetical protein